MEKLIVGIQAKVKGAVESIEEFSQETTAHGVKFFFQGKKLSRIAFIVAWLAAIVYTFYTCYRGIMDFRSRPTGTKMEIITSDYVNVTFPTISLCNINKIQKDYLDSVPDLREVYSLFGKMENPALYDASQAVDKEAILQTLETYKDKDVMNITFEEIMTKGGPADTDIKTCKIGLTDCSAYPELKESGVFKRDVSHHGNCYKINPSGKLTASIAGNLGGMTLFLHAQSAQYDQISLAEPSEGFRISFHDHLSTGSVANTGFVMSPGLSYTIQLSNKLTKTLPKPYGLHDCVEQKTDPNYRRSVCSDECFNEYIVKNCGCSPFPKDTASLSARSCTLKDMFDCVTEAYNTITRDGVSIKKHCGHCQNECTFETYDHSVSASMLSSKFIKELSATLKRQNEDCEKYPDQCGKSDNIIGRFVQDKLVKENLAIVKIVFPTIERQTIQQVVSYGVSNLLGDIGGVMGLFLGASVFTILEFLDFFVRIIFANISNMRKGPTTQSKEVLSET